jgi:hypothetical protein
MQAAITAAARPYFMQIYHPLKMLPLLANTAAHASRCHRCALDLSGRAAPVGITPRMAGIATTSSLLTAPMSLEVMHPRSKLQEDAASVDLPTSAGWILTLEYLDEARQKGLVLPSRSRRSLLCFSCWR